MKSSLKQSAPSCSRQFDIADGVYAGGCLNLTPTQYVIFTTTGIRIVDANGNVITMSPTGITLAVNGGNQIGIGSAAVTITGPLIVNGNLLLTGSVLSGIGSTYPGNITTSGTITATTDVVGGGKSLKTHTHGGVANGGGTTGPPT